MPRQAPSIPGCGGCGPSAGGLSAETIVGDGKLGPRYTQLDCIPHPAFDRAVGLVRGVPAFMTSLVIEFGLHSASPGVKAAAYLVSGIATSLLGRGIEMGVRTEHQHGQAAPVWLLEENQDRLAQQVAHLRQPRGTALSGYLGDMGTGLLGVVSATMPRRVAPTVAAAAVVATGYGFAGSTPIFRVAAAALAPFAWALAAPREPLAEAGAGAAALPGQAEGIVPGARAQGEGIEGQPWQPLRGEGWRVGGPELAQAEPGHEPGMAERAEGQPALSAEGEPDPAPGEQMRFLLGDA